MFGQFPLFCELAEQEIAQPCGVFDSDATGLIPLRCNVRQPTCARAYFRWARIDSLMLGSSARGRLRFRGNSVECL